MFIPYLSYLSPKVEDLWNTWEIRVFVLLSLFVQCILASCASERKRSRKSRPLITLAYSLANWVAPYTIGLISNRSSYNRSSDKHGCAPDFAGIDSNVLAFWAPFLLLHLGGPDNVTSLSADENDMWNEALIRLILQTVTTVSIIFFRSTTNPFNWATQLVFCAGIMKYVERVLSLYFASSRGWEKSSATQMTPDAGPDYEKLSEAQLAMREANLPTQEESVPLPPKEFKPHSSNLQGVELEFDTRSKQLDQELLLQFAQCFYNVFGGLFFGGVSYGHKQRQFTRDFFLKRSSHDAFKLAEIELSFLHKDLHTKAAATPRLDGSPTMRILTLVLITAASILFYRNDKHCLSDEDIGVSYALVFGALVLELVSLLMVLLSGRNAIVFNYYNWVKCIANAIVNMRKWSESFSKCNLICYYLCHRISPRRIRILANMVLIGPALQAWKLKRTVTSDIVSESLKDKIFTELCMRSKLAQNIETATKICSQRGDWVLMQRSCYIQLKWSLGEVEYGHSLLLWHIATDLLCYNIKDCADNALHSERQFCKDISEYLLYLLLAKSNMIDPAAGNWVKIFQDTSLEANRLFRKRSVTDHEQACEAILSVNTDIKPVVLKGDASESVLFDACRLAKQLLGLTEDRRWSLMSGVWMELLTYAAFHSEGTDHAEQPSEGGELLTFVWLLMNHLGLGKQFSEEHARTGYRVVVKK
ncbi:hypothetical protein Vadar_016119 [Vaccinium darrowii]|uniref:Uncharacterized protein n=1 Tax=Vaccinium darrowii TaxID=229202 RepID=A0ACB7ZD03_9ERIC|nr:hypothetical protein Vadar_016119 [Vaccinium darrowii]